MRDAHPDLHEPAAGLRGDDYGCIDNVFTYFRAAGEQRLIDPACGRLLMHMLTRMLRALPCMLQDHQNDCRGRLLHPHASLALSTWAGVEGPHTG